MKSDVVLAAALCSAGDLDAARPVADAALAAADAAGLVPLQWAVACLLADIGGATLTGGARRRRSGPQRRYRAAQGRRVV